MQCEDFPVFQENLSISHNVEKSQKFKGWAFATKEIICL